MNPPASPEDTTVPGMPAAPRAISRQRAAFVHLLISIGVFTVVIVPLLILWYPPPLFFSDGGWNVIQIAFGVDIVVGPLLTLIVFKTGKKSLKFDLSVIALMQVCALIWGVHLMHQERPMFLAFAEDRFSTVTVGQLYENKRPWDELMKLDGHNPPRVFVKLPDSAEETTKLKMSLGLEGKTVFRLTDRYQAMTPANLAAMYSRSVDMDTYLKASAQWRAQYDAFIADNKIDPKDVAFIPLQCRYESLILVLRRTDSEMVGSLHIPPPDYNVRTHANKTGAT